MRLGTFSQCSDFRTGVNYVMMFGSYSDCAGKSVLNCLQAFHWRRVDALEKGIAVIELGMDNLGAVQLYVALFLANFDPLPLSHFVTHLETPVSTSHISDPPIFSKPSTKSPDNSPICKFSLNCSRGFCPGAL